MTPEPGPLAVTPDTRVGQLLERYPEIEEVLITLSPAYKALRNPVLRRTVAKVATLRQVARVGKVPLGDLIKRLREAIGVAAGELPDAVPAGEERPGWATAEAVSRSFDARTTIEAGGHPMPQVMADLARLAPGEVYQLVTPFVPAPLLDLAREKGFRAWTDEGVEGLVRTYFAR